MGARRRFQATELGLLSDLFSAKSLTSMAWYGKSDELCWAWRILEEAGLVTPDTTIADVIRLTFVTLIREYPNEYIYKSCALRKTVFGTHRPSSTSFYIEFPIGEARADAVLVNGNATVIEIKTRFDVLDRLEEQLRQYYKCFALVTVFADAKHIPKLLAVLPGYVGLSTLSPRFSIHLIRRPTPHRESLDYSVMFSVLQMSEYTRFCIDRGENLDGVHPADLYDFCLRAFMNAPLEVASSYVLEALRNRQRTPAIAALCSRLPDALHAAVFSYRLRKSDWCGIVAALDRDIRTCLDRTAI